MFLHKPQQILRLPKAPAVLHQLVVYLHLASFCLRALWLCSDARYYVEVGQTLEGHYIYKLFPRNISIQCTDTHTKHSLKKDTVSHESCLTDMLDETRCSLFPRVKWASSKNSDHKYILYEYTLAIQCTTSSQHMQEDMQSAHKRIHGTETHTGRDDLSLPSTVQCFLKSPPLSLFFQDHNLGFWVTVIDEPRILMRL